MSALSASLLVAPLIAGLFVKRATGSSAEDDLEALLTRIRQTLYPDTVPVLASYWLKTVCAAGHTLRWWKELNRLLKLAVSEPLPDDSSKEAVQGIQNWVQETIVSHGHTPKSLPPQLDPSRAGLPFQKITPYIVRLLNEWLPVEVARLLIMESESAARQDGIPVLASATALERLLLRERLSRQTLEGMLAPELASPEHVYPRDIELLRHVGLWLLGRTWAPDPPIMPAALFCVAPDSQLPADYRRFFHHASLMRRREGDEVHIPISASHAHDILKDNRVRIGSIIVTMDGRWWKSDNIQSAEQHSVVYRPLGRFRIDYSEDHAKLRVPWPETHLRWRGNGYFTDSFRIFGREWRVSRLEADAEHTWLDLECSRILPVSEIVPVVDPVSRCLRPASVDMAWAAMENALKSSVAQKSSEPMENMRHPELIPVGHAILQLTESVVGRRQKNPEVIEMQLIGLRTLQSPIVNEYGRIPWRILPGPVHTALLKYPSGPHLLALLNEVVEGLPEALVQ